MRKGQITIQLKPFTGKNFAKPSYLCITETFNTIIFLPMYRKDCSCVISTCLSVTEGQRIRFDLETSVAVSLAIKHTKLKLGNFCERQSWHQLQAKALASWTDCTNNRQQQTLHVVVCKQLSSLFQEKLLNIILSQSSSCTQQILLFAS